MTPSGVILLVYLIFGIWIYIKLHQPEEEEEPDMLDSARLQGEIDALHKKSVRLQQLDEMIIDLRLCKPAAVQKAFRMEWMSTAGQNHAFDFMADGENASTEFLLQLAITEREEVNADIQARIADLYFRACIEDFSEVVEHEKYKTV